VSRRRARNRGASDVIFAEEITDEEDEELAYLLEISGRAETWHFDGSGNGGAGGGDGSSAGDASEGDGDGDGDDDDGDDDDEVDPTNPIPDHVDPITFEKVVKPAISPAGHVMGYRNWLRCLQSSGNVCPFTKAPLQKRNLVVLTHANIDEYRAKIVTL
jgi:hypothetical protein